MSARPLDTPRQARLSLNRMEAWFRKNAERYTPEDQLTLRALFEEAHTPAHAIALAGTLRAWLPHPPQMLQDATAEPSV